MLTSLTFLRGLLTRSRRKTETHERRAHHSYDTAQDEELNGIVEEEQRVLARVQKHLANLPRRKAHRVDYDQELVALRDEIAEARLEDVPALVEQMERLAAGRGAPRRSDKWARSMPASPYFGRMVLQEGERKREVLIGRATYLDPRTGVQIVDWRDAPVSAASTTATTKATTTTRSSAAARSRARW